MHLAPRSSLLALALALALLLLSADLHAGGAADAVEVEGAHARAVPPGQPNGVAFMTLTNTADTDHALTGGDSAAAGAVELHTHVQEGGMMRMRRVERIALPAGETVRLESGGLHLMLIGLTRRLVPGDQLALTLVFGDGSRKTVTVPVKDIQESMGQHHHH